MNQHRLAETKARFLADGAPVRLGGLAANLARVASFSSRGAPPESIFSLLQESKYFIEWTAREVPLETQTRLLELQRQLVRWTARWSLIAGQPGELQELAGIAREWADRLLKLSGLLDANAGPTTVST